MHRSIPAALISLATLLPLAGCGCNCPSGQSTAGVYQIDKVHLHELVAADARKQAKGQPPGPEAGERLAALIDRVRITLDLRSDGGWTIQGVMDGVEIDDAGTWQAEDATLVLTYTHERGQPSTRVVKGSCANGVARMRPGSGSPGEFRYVRE